MATDLIELEVVVRDKTLKQSLTTVSRLEREITKAAKAVDANTMSQQRYNQVLLSAKRQYEALGVSSQKATAAVRQYAAQVKAASAATNTMGGSVDAMGKRLNRTGVLTQQAGYQVGDFLVQVQSGTNIMVAFGQQATQMVGTFAMLAKSTQAIAIFSALGIAIPIITAVGAALMRTSDSTKTADEKLRSYSDAAKRASEEIAKLRLEEEARRAGAGDTTALLLSQGVEAAQLALDLAKERLNTDMEETAVLDVMVERAETELELRQKLLDEYNKEVLQRERVNQIQSDYEEMLREIREIEDATKAIVSETNSSLADRNALAQAYLDGGDKAVAQQENLQEQAALIKELEGDKYNLSQDQIDAIVEQLKLTQELEAEVEAAKEGLKASADQAKRLADALQAAAGFSAGLDTQVETLKARLAEARGEQGALLELTLQRSLAEADLNAQKQIAAGVDPVVANAQLAIDRARIEQIKTLTVELDNETSSQKASTSAAKDAERAAEQLRREQEKLRKELEAPMVNAIDGVANAWGDFVARGFKDFKGFVNSVLGSFQNMIAQMIAMAARNKIMLSLGLGGSVAGGAASAATSGALGGVTGAIGGAFGTAATGLYTGAVGAFNGLAAGGGLAGMATNIGGLVSGGVAAGGVGGIATAIGAVAAPLLAVAAVFSFFKKKTKELDSGIRGNVEGYDSLIESFQKIQTSRFFGLSKKTSTNYTAMADDNPISQAITSVQMSVLQTAEYLGIATDALNDFSYDFNVSLKGLSEEAKAQKIAEEVQKLGDSFAGLLRGVTSAADLQAIYEERLNLEVRLMQVLGDTQGLRERELAATNEYNRAILEQIYATEDAILVAQESARISQERYDLETKLLQLQGDTQALRDRELATLDESNRALQEQIYATEDAKSAIDELNKALSNLSENDYASLLDFQRAQAAVRMGLPVANDVGAPSMPASSAASVITGPMTSTSGEIAQLRSELREMHKEAMFAYSKLIKNGKDSRDTLRSWDVVGLPAERTA